MLKTSSSTGIIFVAVTPCEKMFSNLFTLVKNVVLSCIFGAINFQCPRVVVEVLVWHSPSSGVTFQRLFFGTGAKLATGNAWSFHWATISLRALRMACSNVFYFLRQWSSVLFEKIIIIFTCCLPSFYHPKVGIYTYMCIYIYMCVYLSHTPAPPLPFFFPPHKW